MGISSDRLAHCVGLLLAKRAPRLIPLSGDERADADYFSVNFKIEGEAFLLDSLEGSTVSCRQWNGEEFSVPRLFSIYDLWLSRPNILHYYGYDEIKWESWDEFAADQRYRLVYLRVAVERTKRRLTSIYYARAKPVTLERVHLLRIIFELQKASDERAAEYITILERALGWGYFLHPGSEPAKAHARALLNGLVETGEIRQVDSLRYSITGPGMAAIERFEEQDAKHRDVIRLQRNMLLLTGALLVAAVFQAGLLKGPPLVEWKRWPWQQVEQPSQRSPQGGPPNGRVPTAPNHPQLAP